MVNLDGTCEKCPVYTRRQKYPEWEAIKFNIDNYCDSDPFPSPIDRQITLPNGEASKCPDYTYPDDQAR